MLVTPRRNDDDRGSALVSVLVMMLVLTLFALTLAAIVSNTTSNLAAGKYTGQARASADAGVAAALAQFRKAEGCTGTLTSSSAPRFSVTCETVNDTVTFRSVGSADSGRSVTVEAVFHYQFSHEYGSTGHELTFFSNTTYYDTDPVSSATSDPANVTIIDGNYSCDAPMALNVVVDGNFTAQNDCTVSGNVTAFGTAHIDGTVRGNLTASGDVVVDGTVRGSVSTQGTVDVYGTVNGNATAGGRGRSFVYGVVGGDMAAAGPVTVYYGDRVEGKLTSASTDHSYIYGAVGGEVKTQGTITVSYNGSIGGDTIAAGTAISYLYGRIVGDFSAGGDIYFADNASVTGNVTVAGRNLTTIYGTIGGDLVTAGAVTIYYNAKVGGEVKAAGTDGSALYGTVTGDFAVAGAALIDYNGVAKASVLASGRDQTRIYATVAKDVKTGGDVYIFYTGRVRGDLSLPNGRTLSPNDASSRVDGRVLRAAAPPAPDKPTVKLPPFEVAPDGPDRSLLFTWQDYGYDAADWVGFSPVFYSGGSSICTSSNWASELATMTTPTVVDATKCKGGLSADPYRQTTVVISTDIVVVSTRINLQQFSFVAAPGTKPHLWFIVPSAGQSVRKDFPGLGRHAGDGTITLNSTVVDVPTMLYTPTTVDYYSGSFTGSMYATTIDVLGSRTTTTATPMDFPIGLWGATGGHGSGGTFSVSPISQREIG